MNTRWIQNRRNGVARIEPRLATIAQLDRLLFIAAFMFGAIGFFMVGALPLPVLGALSAICFIGDALIAVKNLVRAQQRPAAPVTELASVRYR